MKVLFLTHRLPYAPDRGDRLRAYFMIREISRFARVSLISLVHDNDERARASDTPFVDRVEVLPVGRVRNLLTAGLSLPTQRPLTHALLDSAGASRTIRNMAEQLRPSVVVAYCSGMARFALHSSLSRFPLVIDMVDADSAKWDTYARVSRPPLRWIYAREARTLGAFEARAVRRAAATLVVNERERNTLLSLAPEANVIALPNGLELTGLTPPDSPTSAPIVAFCGVMDYKPNEDGVCWFAKGAWPMVTRVVPNARFVIIGSNPTARVRALAQSDSSIEVTGRVDAVQPYLWKAAVSVAPLRLGQGVQNKVLEALAAGLPVVTTTRVLDGLPAAAQPGCLAGDSERDLAEAVIGLLQLGPEERRKRAQSARLDALGWEHSLGPLRQILTDAARATRLEPENATA